MRPALVVKGGLVVDGSGRPPRSADVGVHRGRVVAVEPGLEGETTLDARGAVVAPGFVDIHTHYDAQVSWDPWLSSSSQLGVTSVVLGNCGFSLAPCRPAQRTLLMRTLEAVEDMPYEALEAGVIWDFTTYPEYLDGLERRGLGINVGGYIGHTALRLFALGDEGYEREATPTEIAAMAEIVEQAVLGGALGFSTDRGGFVKGADGRPVPSVVATQDEVEVLALAVGRTRRGIVMVSPGDHEFPWVVEHLAPRLGRPLTWSPIVAFPSQDGSRPLWRRKLDCHLAALDAGVPVHPQVSSRALTFHFTLASPLPLFRFDCFGSLPRSMPHEERVERYTDPAWRDRARGELHAAAGAWDHIVIGETAQRDLLDLPVTELARRRGVDPLDAVLDLSLAEDLRTRFRTGSANNDVDAVTTLLTTPGAVLGLSDAGAHLGQLCDAVLPLDFLAWWVRDRGVMPLEAGIRKLTGELADLLGLADRGYVRPGQWADLVVLDWERLDPGPIRRVGDLPDGGDRLVADAPAGVRHVLVNGVPIRRDEAPQVAGRRPGQVLRSAPV